MDYIGMEVGRVWANVDDVGWFLASDGSPQCKIGTCWELGNQEHIIKMGKALRGFPKKFPSQYFHEIRGKGDFPYLIYHHWLLEIGN